MTLRSWTLAAVLAAAPAFAADPVDYFAMTIPRAWVSTDPAQTGSYERITMSRGCDGRTTFHLVKGAGRHPWASESFYVEGGWVLAMVEVSYNVDTVSEYRTFRQTENLKTGIPWMPPNVGPDIEKWELPVYVEEYWTNEDGVKRCRNTRHDDHAGSLTHMTAARETLSGFLRDLRPASRDRNELHDVDAIRVERVWGVNREIYWYGRFRDPLSGAVEGLGLVRWQWWTGVGGEERLKQEEAFRFLVESRANPLPPCATCPLDQDAKP